MAARLLAQRELAHRARISESTLYGYLRREGSRIPAVGQGRRRRYPESALAVIKRIQAENLRKKRRQRQGFYTLKDIAQLTGISPTTLNKYQREHGREIPSEGQGRTRMYPPEALRHFRRLRDSSRRGPARQDDLARRLQAVERLQKRTNRLLTQLLKESRKPRSVRLITR